MPQPAPLILTCVLVGTLMGCKGGSTAVTPAAADCCQRERDIYEVPELTKAPEFPGGEAAMYAGLDPREDQGPCRVHAVRAAGAVRIAGPCSSPGIPPCRDRDKV